MLSTETQQRTRRKPVPRSLWTKERLILELSRELELRQVLVRRLLERAFSHVGEALLTGDRVFSWPGFGTFTARWVPTRTVPHPATGQPVELPPVMRVRFRASSVLKRNAQPEDEG